MVKYYQMTKLKKLMRLLQLINQLYKSPPKNVEQIGEILEVSSRSVYRYLDLLELSGFHVRKNEKNQYFIDNVRDIPQLAFSEEEAELISQALHIHAKGNSLLGSIQTKLNLVSSNTITAAYINSAKNGKIVELLNESIVAQKQAVLKKYQSINSQTIADRTVEVISIDANYRTITAFEVGAKTNKTFVIERIEDVVITPYKFKHKGKHVETEKDVFGFSPREDAKTFPINLELSLKAKVLLTEEYPETAQFITKKRKSEVYIFQCDVNDPRPIQRFINGLPKEINLLENHNPMGVTS